MTKQEQIEEIKRDIKKALEFDCSKAKCKTCKHKNEDNCEVSLITDYLIEQGYRKIPKDTLVLLIGKHNQPLDEETIEYFVNHNQEIRKETAKEILNYFDRYAGTGEKLIGNMISEQRKKYGLEVEE